jgi:CheY-like chemotaxis protein
MDTREIIEIVLRFFEILTAWPVILLVIVLFLRRELRTLIDKLGQRLRKASIAGGSFEFSEVAIKALEDTITTGAEEYKNNPVELVNFIRSQIKKLSETKSLYPSEPPPLLRRSILWVDDNPMNNVYEAKVLKGLGASIIFAITTYEGLALLNQEKYDLIISDINRVENGKVNHNAGYELLEAVKRKNPEMPFIFYTASVTNVDNLKVKLANGTADTSSRLFELVYEALSLQ